MSQDTERIPVPSNGRGPHPDSLPGTSGPSPTTPAGAVPREQTGTFTPNQLAAGFGILAGLLLLFVGARRRRGGPGRGE